MVGTDEAWRGEFSDQGFGCKSSQGSLQVQNLQPNICICSLRKDGVGKNKLWDHLGLSISSIPGAWLCCNLRQSGFLYLSSQTIEAEQGLTHEYPETAHLDNVPHWKVRIQGAEIEKKAPQDTFPLKLIVSQELMEMARQERAASAVAKPPSGNIMKGRNMANAHSDKLPRSA